MAKITVQNTQITVIKQNEDDYISLTDMLKDKDGEFFFLTGCATAIPLSSLEYGSG